MALTKMVGSVSVHQSLNDDPALSTSDLKKAWDEPAEDLQDFINDTLIDELDTALASKIATSSIINNLTTGGTTVPLSAEQGKTLKTSVDAKIATSSIVNDLTSGGTAVPLSAEQGKTLKTALDLKSPIANPTFTGTGTFDNLTATGIISLPATTSIGNVSATELDYVNGVTSAIQTQLNTKQKSITSGTAEPSGGSDGDIYIQYV